MKISKTGVNIIKKFEGLRLTAYRDPVGVLTIGYGHTIGVKAGDKITEVEAEAYLLQDLATAETAVNALLKHYTLWQCEYDALVSFTFNCGSGNLRKLTNNNRRNKGQIADAILLYNKAGGQTLKGLTKRRKVEHDLFCGLYDFPVENPYNVPRVSLKLGSKGNGVKWLQYELNHHGYDLKVDGTFGKNTDKAVRDYQSKHNLVVDGIVGKNTRESLLS